MPKKGCDGSPQGKVKIKSRLQSFSASPLPRTRAAGEVAVTLRCAAAGALKAMCRSSGMQDAMRTSPVITIQGRTRSWKISSSPPIAPSSPVTERTNTASSSSDSERMFNCMHVGGAVSGSDESEDEGEEDRGLGTTNLERMSLTSHKKKENESPSPVPKDASTSAWERLMQPDPMSLPSPSKGLPWGPKGSHESFADLDVDAHDDDERLFCQGHS